MQHKVIFHKNFLFFFNQYITLVIFNSKKPEKQSDEALVKKFKSDHDLNDLGVLFNR